MFRYDNALADKNCKEFLGYELKMSVLDHLI